MKVGDVVTLNGDRFKTRMAVTKINGDLISCTWFRDSEGEVMRYSFPAAALKVVPVAE